MSSSTLCYILSCYVPLHCGQSPFVTLLLSINAAINHFLQSCLCGFSQLVEYMASESQCRFARTRTLVEGAADRLVQERVVGGVRIRRPSAQLVCAAPRGTGNVGSVREKRRVWVCMRSETHPRVAPCLTGREPEGEGSDREEE